MLCYSYGRGVPCVVFFPMLLLASGDCCWLVWSIHCVLPFCWHPFMDQLLLLYGTKRRRGSRGEEKQKQETCKGNPEQIR